MLANRLFEKWKSFFFLRTKTLTRKGLDRFLDVNLPDNSALCPAGVLNIGAGGEIGARVHAFGRSTGISICSVDIDTNRAPTVVSDVCRLPFVTNSWDIVVCMEVLEHVHDPGKAAIEMHRVLKPGGLLILSTRYIFPLHDRPHDFFRFTRYGLEYLFRDFSSVTVSEQHSWTETIAVLIARLLSQPNRWVGLMAPFIYLGAVIISRIPSLGPFKSDFITSGYFVRAIK